MSQNDKKLNKLIVELSSIYANVSLLGITLAYLSSFVFDGKNISYKTVILLIPILMFLQLFSRAIVDDLAMSGN